MTATVDEVCAVLEIANPPASLLPETMACTTVREADHGVGVGRGGTPSGPSLRSMRFARSSSWSASLTNHMSGLKGRSCCPSMPGKDALRRRSEGPRLRRDWVREDDFGRANQQGHFAALVLGRRTDVGAGMGRGADRRATSENLQNLRSAGMDP